MGRSPQVGKIPATYAHLLNKDWAVGYKSLTLIKERRYTFVDREAHALEVPSVVPDRPERVLVNFATGSFFRAAILYAKFNVILSQVDEAPAAFVRAVDAQKCMVQASDSECWILTVRELEQDPT